MVRVNVGVLPEPYYSRKRYLRRQWKAKKPHLPKWSSVSTLRLAPPNETLRTCPHCGFAFAVQSLPFCVWCRSESKVAHTNDEHGHCRQRRASEPSYLPSYQVRRAEHLMASRLNWSNHAAGDSVSRRDVVSKGWSNYSPLDSSVVIASNSYHTGPDTRRSFHLPSYSFPSNTSVAHPDMGSNIDSLSVLLAVDSSAGLTATNKERFPEDLGSPVPRILKRKKHMSGLRGSSSSTIDSPAERRPRYPPRPSLSDDESFASLRSSSIPITFVQTHSRSFSQPSVSQLGRPARPYYSAIRSNMTPQPSFDQRASMIPSSAQLTIPTIPLSPPGLAEDEIPPTPIVTPNSPFTPSPVKFPSLSFRFHSPTPLMRNHVEKEMRLALARDLGNDYELRFKDQCHESPIKSKLKRGLLGILGKV